MTKAFVFLIVLTTLIACKKHKPEVYKTPTYQHYENNFLTHFGNFRLFTKAGEITDAGLVQQYFNEFPEYFYDRSSKLPWLEFRRFAVVNNDSIINVSLAPVAELKRTNIDNYDKFSSNYSQPVNDTNDLVLHISKYKTFQVKTTPLNHTYLDVEMPVYFMKKVNDTLFFPIVRYVTVSRRDYTMRFSANRFNNVFSAAGVSKLGATDTLLIQTFDLAMTRVKE